MSSRPVLYAACALALLCSLPGRAQDSPSLGDLARQAQKDKEKSGKPAPKVITNDDVPSSSGSGGTALGAAFGQVAPSAPVGKAAPAASPMDQLAKLETQLEYVNSLDRDTLAHSVLQGEDVSFPGRSAWEEKLFAAKQTYVAQGRAMAQRAKQIMASADALKGVHDQTDPRVKDLATNLQGLVRDGVRLDAAFQAVILEGRDLASQAAPH